MVRSDFYRFASDDRALEPIMPVILTGNFPIWRAKNNHFIQF